MSNTTIEQTVLNKQEIKRTMQENFNLILDGEVVTGDNVQKIYTPDQLNRHLDTLAEYVAICMELRFQEGKKEGLQEGYDFVKKYLA